MTLWGAYQLANKRRAALAVWRGPDLIRVGPRLLSGSVTYRDDAGSHLADPEAAKALLVERVK